MCVASCRINSRTCLAWNKFIRSDQSDEIRSIRSDQIRRALTGTCCCRSQMTDDRQPSSLWCPSVCWVTDSRTFSLELWLNGAEPDEWCHQRVWTGSTTEVKSRRVFNFNLETIHISVQSERWRWAVCFIRTRTKRTKQEVFVIYSKHIQSHKTCRTLRCAHVAHPLTHRWTGSSGSSSCWQADFVWWHHLTDILNLHTAPLTGEPSWTAHLFSLFKPRPLSHLHSAGQSQLGSTPSPD